MHLKSWFAPGHEALMADGYLTLISYVIFTKFVASTIDFVMQLILGTWRSLG